MILAAHQPNYLPWLGYFYKLAQADVFVILDDVQFTKNSYQNRTRIKGPKGPVWLTQPVLQSRRALQATDDVEFDSRVDWRGKHLKTFAANYARAADAGELLPLCREWLLHDDNRLAGINIHLIRQVAQLLGLGAEIVLSSTLDVNLTKADRLVEICCRLGATTYLSGQGAKSYQEETQFEERGIKLAYSDFTPLPYAQLWDEFCPGLSVVDALFNLGPEGTAKLLG